MSMFGAAEEGVFGDGTGFRLSPDGESLQRLKQQRSDRTVLGFQQLPQCSGFLWIVRQGFLYLLCQVANWLADGLKM